MKSALQALHEGLHRSRHLFTRRFVYTLPDAPATAHREAAAASRGRFRFRSERSIWIYGNAPEQFLAADGFLRSLSAHAPGYTLVMLTDHPHTEAWLRLRFPNDRVQPAPWRRSRYVERFFDQLQPQFIVLLQNAHGLNPLVLDQAHARGVGVALIDGRPHPAQSLRAWSRAFMHPAFEHLCVQRIEFAILLRRRRIAPDKITTTGHLGFEAALHLPPGNPEYLRGELRLPPGCSILMVENPHYLEEPSLFAFLNASETGIGRQRPVALLIKPRSAGQATRLLEKATRLGFPARHWKQEGPAELARPALVTLDPHLSPHPFYPVCRAIVAGGSFTRAPALQSHAEPITLHAPVLYGNRVSATATTAEMMMEAHAAYPCEKGEFSAFLSVHWRDQVKAVMAREAGASQRTFETLRHLMNLAPARPRAATPLPTAARPQPIPNTTTTMTASAALSPSVPKELLPHWGAFIERLRPGRTILCLGNGPTSELPEIATLGHDTLLRVNWRWKERGILTRPDAVFVGTNQTFRELRETNPLYVLDPWEGPARLTDERHFAGCTSPLTFFQLSEDLVPVRKGVHLSNGALMIIVAAALCPESIIIAGIDLFQHPDGRYPGDLQAVNTYSHAHETLTELGAIHHALRQFPGRIVIKSSILTEALVQRSFPPERLHSA